jgi:hypothetical protein
VRNVYPGKEPESAAMIRACSWWRKAVPSRVFARARPVRLLRGTLYIHTATSAWAAELDLLKLELLASLRRQAPESGVRALYFRTGPLPDLPPLSRTPEQTAVQETSAALPEALARALAAIDDDALREAISRAAGVSLARSKAS